MCTLARARSSPPHPPHENAAASRRKTTAIFRARTRHQHAPDLRSCSSMPAMAWISRPRPGLASLRARCGLDLRSPSLCMSCAGAGGGCRDRVEACGWASSARVGGVGWGPGDLAVAPSEMWLTGRAEGRNIESARAQAGRGGREEGELWWLIALTPRKRAKSVEGIGVERQWWVNARWQCVASAASDEDGGRKREFEMRFALSCCLMVEYDLFGAEISYSSCGSINIKSSSKMIILWGPSSL
ncbi:hypothetical protein C8J57DRAFT_1477284 [Mycena rebaudengoi]|nr:hypothetical protein C8J57DRAFT_1477284 [Mycena rebaudengoi]